MTLCADTSFLLSLYGADANTEAAVRCIQARRSPLHVQCVSAFEFVNAIRLREFRGKFTAEEARRIIELYEKDVAAQRVEEVGLDLPAVFDVASELSRSHTTAIGARAYDILQVAAAVVLNAGEFLSFDERQRKARGGGGPDGRALSLR